MTTDYNPIAEKYKRSKLQPWRTHIESFTLLELIGDLAGKSVLDVACGEGYYTRLVRQRGAAQVLGVDLSDRMIELARAQESAEPLGIEYRVGDGRNLQLPEKRELVVAAYLLNYARDRGELAAMARGIAACLKPGGRFVTVNSSPLLDFSRAPSFKKYGFETTFVGQWREGTPITWTFYLDDGAFQLENYYLDAAVHEDVFRTAGFREIHWHVPRLSADGESEFGRQFWDTFLASPPVAFIECTL